MQLTGLTSVPLLKKEWNVKTLFYLGTALFTIGASSPAYAESFDLGLPKSNWSGYFGLGYSQNIYDSSSYDASQTYDFTTRIKYSGTWGDIRLTGGGEKQRLHGEEETFFDPLLEYRLPLYDLSETVSLRGSVGVYLPLSKTSKNNRLEYVTRVATYLYWKPTDSLNFYIAPRYRNYTYRYKTAGKAVLIEHQYQLLADVTWLINSTWYLDFSGSYKRARNYNGRKMNGKFSSTQELGWEFSPDWEVAVGHTNSGSIFNYDVGPSRSFELYDKKGSQFYLSVTKYM